VRPAKEIIQQNSVCPFPILFRITRTGKKCIRF
jgi:hypothetical protein